MKPLICSQIAQGQLNSVVGYISMGVVFLETFALPVKCMLASNLETFAQHPDADMGPFDASHPIFRMFNYFHQILQFVFQEF